MKDIIFIYDDTLIPNEKIQGVVGEYKFSEIVLKRKSLKRHMTDAIKQYKIASFVTLADWSDIDKKQYIEYQGAIVVIPSYVVIKNYNEFEILMGKLPYITDNIKIAAGMSEALIFSCGNSFVQYLDTKNAIVFSDMQSDIFSDISDIKSFVPFITSGFDARFFNTLSGNQYTITKTSTDKEKIKKEYLFYSLLPENMKMWFVLPFDYLENKDTAAYTMEKYNMTDLAIRWIHGAITLTEMDHILQKIFYFVKHRQTKEMTLTALRDSAEELFITKVRSRATQFKALPVFSQIERHIQSSTCYSSFDAIIDKYCLLFAQMGAGMAKSDSCTVSHGDLCFSNILYDSGIDLLKLIDPKGALNESDLYMTSYYDVVKLSHSICGRYDFFNADMFDIGINSDLQMKVIFSFDNCEYIAQFKKHLEQNGFDYAQVRLYEASLFLSMLPLHIDNPHKVLGFILNAIDILEEVMACLNS